MFGEKISAMASGKRRKILRVLGFLFVALLIFLAAMPLWFPWVLKPVAKKLGAGYSAYEREGYTRFHLRSVTFTNDAAVIHAETMTALVPTAWLWRMVSSSKPGPFVQVNTWEYLDQPRSNRTASVSTNFIKLTRTLAPVKRWIPNATMTNGMIVANRLVYRVPGATWVAGDLSADMLLPQNVPAVLRASLTPGAPVKLFIDSEPLDLRSELSAADVAGTLQIEGTAFWMTNRVAIAAAFPRKGLLPDTGSMRADAFEIPASRLRLNEYSNVNGSWRLEWSTNHFTLDLNAKAIPLSANLPLLNIEARASGDTNAVAIDSLRVEGPGLRAELEERAIVQFTPPFLANPATLTVSGDLKEQSWLPATGGLQGKAVLSPGDRRYPRVNLTLTGSNVIVSNVYAVRWQNTRTNRAWKVPSLRVEGEFVWPDLKLSSVHIGLADGSVAVLTGALDVRERTIANGELNYSGTFGREFLPPGYSFEHSSLKARFSGPITNISHAATVEATRLQFPGSLPMHFDAELKGHGPELEQASALLTAGTSSVRIQGSLHAVEGTNDVTLTELTLESGTNELRLDHPFAIRVAKPVGEEITTTNAWRIEVQPVRWTDSDQELSLEGNLQWPERGSFRVAARGLNGGLLKEFVGIPGTNATVNRLLLNGGWTNGPIAFALGLNATLDTAQQLSFSAQANVVGGTNGIAIEECSISSSTQVVCYARGTLPVYFEPGRTNGVLRIDTEAPLALTAATEPDSILWDVIANVGGLSLHKPNLRVNIGGTWAAPQGRIIAGAGRIQYTRAGQPLPTLQDVDFELDLDREAARLSRFDAEIEGEPFHVKGEVPLGEKFWAGLQHGKYLPDWHEGTGELKIEDAQLSKFDRFTPDFLAPQGTVTVDVRLERDRQFHGEIALRDVKTRPVWTLGPVRNIEGSLNFTGSLVKLENLSGEIGGQPVTVTGSAWLNERFWQEKQFKLPRLQIHVYGTNVPLVRRPEVVVRSDLDLSITNSAAAEGMISGKVHLRDSFFLSDLQSLTSGGVAGPALRPPFFSIATGPWAGWRLDVNVDGEKFLRVRGPLFRGIISTTFKLEGTLKEPQPLGEARIVSGAVTFPFGSLSVQQGFVTMASDDPHRLKLYVVATAERMNYDVRMTVTGFADEPIIQFSSTPSLSSEQIVLMLTTGQVPPGALATTTTTQRRAQGLVLFVGKNFLSELGFGGGAGEDRLTFRSGEQVTASGQPTYTVEYKLTDRWTLVGEYDRFSQYNLDLKWRVFSR
jgi:translocation and assembly module TamB